jgi:hypothetical protein
MQPEQDRNPLAQRPMRVAHADKEYIPDGNKKQKGQGKTRGGQGIRCCARYVKPCWLRGVFAIVCEDLDKREMKIILSHIKKIPYGSGTCRGSEAARQRSFSFAVKRVDIEVFDNVANNFVNSRYRQYPANPTTPPHHLD